MGQPPAVEVSIIWNSSSPGPKALESRETLAFLTHGALSILTVGPRAEDEAVSVPKAVPILGAHVEDQKSKSLPRAVKESRQLEKEGM